LSQGGSKSQRLVSGWLSTRDDQTAVFGLTWDMVIDGKAASRNLWMLFIDLASDSEGK
jgi:hypothetical protein